MWPVLTLSLWTHNNNRDPNFVVSDTGALVQIIYHRNNIRSIFFDKTDYTHVHINVCECEILISSRVAVCRHYTNISYLLYLINAVVGKRTIQEDTYKFTMLSAHIYCRLNSKEFIVFNFFCLFNLSLPIGLLLNFTVFGKVRQVKILNTFSFFCY
jgi:hypothetical protein